MIRAALAAKASIAVGIVFLGVFAFARDKKPHYGKRSSIDHVSKAQALAARGDYEQAIIECNKAIAADPLYTYAYSVLGDTYRLQKRYSEAMAEFRKAQEMDPQNVLPHLDMGKLYFEQDKLSDAVAEYKRAIELDPQGYVPHYNLGIIFDSQGRYDEAIAEYKKALELKPGDTDTQSKLDAAYKAKGGPSTPTPTPAQSAPPTIVVVEPAVAQSGQTLEVSDPSLTIRGAAMDISGFPTVAINGSPAAMRPKSPQAAEFWSDPIALHPGENKFDITATNAGHAETRFSFVARYTPKAAAASVNPKALSKAEILDLLTNFVPSSRVAEEVKKRGVKFTPTEEDLREIRQAGGADDLIQSLKEFTRPN